MQTSSLYIPGLIILSSPALFGQACPVGTQPAPAAVVGLCEHKLGLADYAAGHRDQAEAHYLRALSAWEQAGDRYDAQHVTTLIGLGRLYQATYRSEDAARVLTRAVELGRPLATVEPQLTAIALSRLGGLYSVSGSVEQARSTLTEAIARLRALASPNLPELAWAYNARGMSELRAGDYPAGESWLRQAVAIATDCLGEGNTQTAIYQTYLGLALYLQGRYSRALPLLRRAEFLLEARPDENAFQLGTALAELSAVEAALGKLALAENDGSRAVAVFSRQFPPGSSEIARARVNLAAVYLIQHRTAEAAAILPDAVATERRLHTDGRVLADGIRWLAQLRAQQRDWCQAKSLYREAVEMYEGQPGPAHEIDPVRREYAKLPCEQF